MTTLPAPALLNRGHDIGWVTAAPLWPALLAGTPDAERLGGMQRPAVLRLNNDDFMAELTGVLAAEPADLAGLVATPTTYRPGPPGAATARPIDHVKLFQPVHGHFNLVVATLVCRVPGLPDRTIDPAGVDEIGFVLRRSSEQREAAWTSGGWTELAEPDALAPAEQLFPLFPVLYETDGGRRRRLFVGLIPTASPASAKDGGFSPLVATGPAAGVPADARLDELETKVARPLRQMTGLVKAGEDVTDRDAFLRLSLGQRQEVSRFVLLDFADLLLRFAPQLWAAVSAGQLPAPGALRTAYELLRDQ
ncbi:MAG: hypothetical protein QOE53_2286, partial [Pseudonocardiales bacterium]|nr:hypothetical protein [Pseudonocardiales bacterium]